MKEDRLLSVRPRSPSLTVGVRKSQKRRPVSERTLGLCTVVVVCAAFPGGCGRDARLVDRNVRTVTVEPTTLYGMALDEKATPRQVTYVLLRAIRDDFLAKTDEARGKAMDAQFAVAAANVIGSRNRSALSRDEFVHRVVTLWTPVVSHYVNDFETDWEKAKARLVPTNTAPLKGGEEGAKECAVAMELNHPSGDPNARVVMAVYLAQDKGLWRVVHLGFDPSGRSIQALRQAVARGAVAP